VIIMTPPDPKLTFLNAAEADARAMTDKEVLAAVRDFADQYWTRRLRAADHIALARKLFHIPEVKE
jgi:hypothetical protein